MVVVYPRRLADGDWQHLRADLLGSTRDDLVAQVTPSHAIVESIDGQVEVHVQPHRDGTEVIVGDVIALVDREKVTVAIRRRNVPGVAVDVVAEWPIKDTSAARRTADCDDLDERREALERAEDAHLAAAALRVALFTVPDAWLEAMRETADREIESYAVDVGNVGVDEAEAQLDSLRRAIRARDAIRDDPQCMPLELARYLARATVSWAAGDTDGRWPETLPAADAMLGRVELLRDLIAFTDGVSE